MNFTIEPSPGILWHESGCHLITCDESVKCFMYNPLGRGIDQSNYHSSSCHSHAECLTSYHSLPESTAVMPSSIWPTCHMQDACPVHSLPHSQWCASMAIIVTDVNQSEWPPMSINCYNLYFKYPCNCPDKCKAKSFDMSILFSTILGYFNFTLWIYFIFR